MPEGQENPLNFRLHERYPRLRMLALAASAALTSTAHAGGEQELQKITITGSGTGLVGAADSANVGTVTQKQLEARTVYRPGELLEATPGLIVSQHSGEGKANQFYLRGFNLDHGTDLRTTVDGMLVNQRSHGHGLRRRCLAASVTSISVTSTSVTTPERNQIRQYPDCDEHHRIHPREHCKSCAQTSPHAARCYPARCYPASRSSSHWQQQRRNRDHQQRLLHGLEAARGIGQERHIRQQSQGNQKAKRLATEQPSS